MKRNFTVLLIFLAILLAACSNSTPAPATPTTPQGPTPTQAPTPTVAATATSTPGKAFLVAPDPAAALAVSLKARLSELATAQGLVVESRASLQPSDLAPNVRIVVLLAAPANLNDLLVAAPRTQFLLIGDVSASPQPNLSVIRRDPNRVAFVAGYVATVISTDWRSAALLPDSPASLQQAFLNGGSYWCGRCAPIHGPIVIFPLVSALPANSSLGAWQDALTRLKASILETLYVDPTISSPDLLKLLGGQTMILVGGQTPADETLRQHWAATVSSDVMAPLSDLWPGLLAGKGGQSAAARVTLSDVNPALFSPGRQSLTQQVINSIAAGTLDALTPQ